MFGWASWVRISSASTPPARKKISEAMPIPMIVAIGTARTPSARLAT